MWQQMVVARKPDARQDINLLLVPWPKQLKPDQFSPAEAGVSAKMLVGRHGFFGYLPRPMTAADIRGVGAIYGEAVRKVGRIDGVIFPERAMHPGEFAQVRWELHGRHEGFPVAGLYLPSADGRPAHNYAAIVVNGVGPRSARSGSPSFVEHEYHKHHRWFLDGGQIDRYGLSNQLNPGNVRPDTAVESPQGRRRDRDRKRR